MIDVVVKDIAIGAGSGVRFPGRSNRTHCRQRLATAAMFLRSYVAQTIRSGDGPRRSLWSSAASMMKT